MDPAERSTRIPKTYLVGLAAVALVGYTTSQTAITLGGRIGGIVMLTFVGINVIALTAGYFARKGANIADRGSHRW